MDKEINDEFCKEVGLTKKCCYLLNKDTGELRFYSNLSGLYKKPSGWKHIEKGKFEPRYPDFINNPFNFCILLNVQWYLEGKLGDVYTRNGDESFECNYLKTRLKALKMCKALGGGEILDEYKKQLKELSFDYMEEQ